MFRGLFLVLCQTAAIWIPASPPAFGQSIPPPRDIAFHGVIRLDVDATDTIHKIFSVHETIPVQAAGPLVLLYPEWDTGSHAPTISVANLAGLIIRAGDQRAGDQRLEWERDAIDPHAFHVHVPPSARMLNAEFQYLSPPTPRSGAMLVSADITEVPWQNMLLYPAGWFARDITVQAALELPRDYQYASALESKANDKSIVFSPTTLESLADSPVYAGRHYRRWDLAPGDSIPVHLNVFSDRDEDNELSPADLAHLRDVVRETWRLFRSCHFEHYDFLLSLSDFLPNDGGVEHLQSSEVNLPSDYFRKPGDHLTAKNLMAHEYVHSWNGLYRQPADLWTPNLNTPMRDSLLWVYEGQTEYWALAIAARAGQLASQQALDVLALDAAAAEARTGRSWKSLADSNHDPLYDAGHSVPWPDWQRREDYYGEGVLLWLDVDTMIQSLTSGRRSLADFAHAFFGGGHADLTPRTYTFAELCDGLREVAPGDWKAFLLSRLQAHDATHLLDGLRHAGYDLVFTDQPSEVFHEQEIDDGDTDLSYSIGLKVGKTGNVRAVTWQGPAFVAGVNIGAQIQAVNSEAFDPHGLEGAVDRANTTPLRLDIVEDGESRIVKIAYHGKLRYPRLERIAGVADRLSPWLAPQGTAAAP